MIKEFIYSLVHYTVVILLPGVMKTGLANTSVVFLNYP